LLAGALPPRDNSLQDRIRNSYEFAMSADRNKLFGLLAVRLDLVTKDALIARVSASLLDKEMLLDDNLAMDVIQVSA
jgi:hypothetical protein